VAGAGCGLRDGSRFLKPVRRNLRQPVDRPARQSRTVAVSAYGVGSQRPEVNVNPSHPFDVHFEAPMGREPVKDIPNFHVLYAPRLPLCVDETVVASRRGALSARRALSRGLSSTAVKPAQTVSREETEGNRGRQSRSLGPRTLGSQQLVLGDQDPRRGRVRGYPFPLEIRSNVV
jgi:hypothetical protein